MRTMKKTNTYFVILLAAGISLAAIGAQAAMADTYDASSIHMENVIGRVEITTGNVDAITVEVDPGANVVALPVIRQVGDTLQIKSKREVKLRQCEVRGTSNDDGYKLKSVKLQLKGDKKRKLSAFPSYRITVPADTDFTARKGVLFASAEDLGATDVSINSCGDFRMGDVGGDLKVTVNGSGDFWAGSIAGNVSAKVNGSGDIGVGDATGDADLNINGSGDIEVGAVQDVRAHINGSGDIVAVSSNGKVKLSINGSGDIGVKAGNATPFSAFIRGSGDIFYGGHANGVTVGVSGSGDIDVRSFEGDLDTGGYRTEIEIDGKRLRVGG